jgi:glycosyltransferase involved in cell wall biosynthesis
MRIILATDAPWYLTANALQMGELARRLRDDLHTVYWMPTKGFSDGGRLTWEGIEVLPGDDSVGNDVIKHHAAFTGAQVVITRGDAGFFQHYGGSDFTWVAWHPGDVTRKVLRKSTQIIATNPLEQDWLEKRGVLPRVFPNGIRPAFTDEIPAHSQKAFRAPLQVPEDAFFITAVGAHDPHWKRMLEALAIFMRRHEDTYAYLHTDTSQPLPLAEYAETLGVPQERLRFPDSYSYHMGYTDPVMAAMYATSQVHIVPGRAVLPALEAMACGTPVLTTERPEIAEVMGFDGLGATVPPVTWHEEHPLLDVEGYVRELENCYAMSPEARGTHSACCQMVVKEYRWKDLYESYWKPLIAELEEEGKFKANRVMLKGSVPDDGRRDTKFLEDRGYVEQYGCEIVRKYDMGGSSQDEREQNAAVIALGPHANVISILGKGVDEQGHPWFDAPKLVGLDRVKDFSAEQGDRILADLRAGLQHLHEGGIAHCDLSPKNILLTDTEQKPDGSGIMGPDARAVIFDFDFIQTGLDPDVAALCDYDPLHPEALPYAVPVMASGIATRGFHRVVTHVRNLPFDANSSTSKPDVPYQQIDGVGERDCDERWLWMKPDVQDKRVLDLGCNLGYFSARALKEGAESIQAVDRDRAIVTSARLLHPELDGNVAQMDLNDTLPEGEYDVAFCLSVWQHLKAGKRGLLEFLKTIPVVYWEDANLTAAQLEQMGFGVERLARSERGRNLFRLTSKGA